MVCLGKAHTACGLLLWFEQFILLDCFNNKRSDYVVQTQEADKSAKAR